jgi:hypothetical protein
VHAAYRSSPGETMGFAEITLTFARGRTTLARTIWRQHAA